MNTIDNINAVFTTTLLYLLGTKASYFGRSRSYVVQLSLTLIVFLYLWIWFPTTMVPVVITSLISGVLTSWDFLLSTELAADFPRIGLTSMYYTMNASGSNLGKMLFIHTAILDKYPWKKVALLGLILQLILIIFIPKAYQATMDGETSIDSFYNE